MLRITLDLSDFISKQPKDSIGVSYLSLVSVVPGSGYGMVRVTKKNDHFYLYIPAVHEGKNARDPPAILPGAGTINERWKEAFEALAGYKRPADASSAGCILHIIVYAIVSSSVPNESLTIPGLGNKPLGEWETYALQNKTELTGVSPAKALEELGYDTLSTVRIGQAKISIPALAKWALLGGQLRLSTPLEDYTNTEDVQGYLNLKGEYIKEYEGIQIPIESERIVQQVSLETPEYTIEKYQKLLLESRRVVYQDYVNEYVKMFPPIPGWSDEGRKKEKGELTQLVLKKKKARFAQTSSTGLKYSSDPTTDQIVDRERLGTDVPATVSLHQPITSIDGDIPVPIGFYYKQPVDPQFISEYYHQTYLGSMLANVCAHEGITVEQFAQAMHTMFDLMKTTGVANPDYSLSPMFLLALRISGMFFTHNNFRYRSDFALETSGIRTRILLREDTSRDLLMGLNSEDCDGMDMATQTIMWIVWTGVENVANPKLQSDPLYQILTSLSGTKKKFGGWAHEGLSALQRLLFHYTPLSIDGALTRQFPGEPNEMPRIRIDDLDDVTSKMDPKEVRKLFLKSSEMGKFVGHRFGILLPTMTAIDALCDCFRNEDRLGVKRHSSDQELVTKIEKIKHELITLVGRWRQRALPPLLLDGTLPTNPFALMGASNWCNQRYQHELRQIESQNRKLSGANRNNTADAIVKDDIWFERGVIPFDEGQLQSLRADDVTRRASLPYKMLMMGHIAFFDDLFDTYDFDCAFVNGPQYNKFGVDIENVLGPAPSTFGLAIAPHRIPKGIRDQARRIGETYLKWRNPAQICAYSSQNTILPVKTEEMWAIGSQQSHFDDASAAKAFSRNFVSVNANIISDIHLKEFESELQQKATDIRKSKEKLQPFGPVVNVYSFVPK